MVSLSNHPDSVLRQAQDERIGYIPLMVPLMVSLSNHHGSVLRQAQDERIGYIPLMVPFMMPLMVSLSNHPHSVLRQAQDERGGYIPLMVPLMVSLSNHPHSVLRQAQDERGGYIPLMVSLSNHPHSVLRQAQDERRGQGWEFPVNRHSHHKQPSLSTTVVPAKAGIQEIPRKRAGRLPRVLDSGFRRNDGFVARLTWGFPVFSPFVGITIHVGAGL